MIYGSLMLFVIFLVALFVLVIYNYIKHLVSLRKYPKGPFPLPIIGNLHLLSKKPYEDFNQLAKTYGGVFSVSICMNRLVIVNSAEAGREALIIKSQDFAGRPQNIYTYKLMTRNNQDMAFTDYGPLWKMLRKLAHSVLRLYGENMERYEKWVVTESEELHQIILKADGKAIDPEHEIGCSILNVICQKTFGVRYKRENDEFKHLIENLGMIFASLRATEAVAFVPWLSILPLQGVSKLKKGVSYRDKYFREKVKEHQINFDSKCIKDFTDAVIRESQDQTFAKRFGVSGFTTDMIEMFLFDVFVGGLDTILTSVRWFIIFMVHWDHLQDKLFEEIIKVVGKKRYPSFKDRENLKFLQACIHETMRLSTITGIGAPRKTTKETSLTGITVPKNSIVIFNFWNYHMNDEYWEDPHIFNPYRWLSDDGNDFVAGKYSCYLPFSAGVRGCPGESLAKFEVFMFISRLFRDFRVEKDPDGSMPSLEKNLGLVMTPNSYRVKFTPRADNLIGAKGVK